ncbi:cell wall-active antibiotics response protein [Bacillus luteolus]|uniref:Cell wall-active antibiotics response protein n=1 Tax=Litchfieldia luteola TaxID=682179 RepID=A0ABR9QEA0_9BACI|nr:cell wall-active antibiotics response protein LiaF [Cytobacillus luteolus]MBE4906815.1 cell wall-active antibiotics response protein [Cytobacillus luteolus]MBP1940531.1 lia operon protein LiaF [Cytobacillus luteolus]
MKQFTLNRVFSALLLILFGILLLLVNIDVISLEINNLFVTFYPVLFLIVGFKWLVESILSKGQKGWFGGFFLLLFGTLLALDRLGYITFTFWDVWKLWPVLLIYLGMKLFSKEKSVSISFAKKDSVAIGDYVSNSENWSLEDKNIKLGIGDVHLDFSKAFIPDKETKIDISGWVGDVTLLVPEDLAIKVEATVKTGSIEIFDNDSDGLNRSYSYKSEHYDEETRKLTININLSVGSIQVEKV